MLPEYTGVRSTWGAPGTTVIRMICIVFCTSYYLDMPLPLSVTVIGLLGAPLKPRVMLITLNEQFLSVSDSCRLEQTADVSLLREQVPQLEVMRY